MAIPIQHPPVLSGVAAKRMFKAIEQAEKNRGSIDFSKQIAACNQILERSRSYLDGTETPPVAQSFRL